MGTPLRASGNQPAFGCWEALGSKLPITKNTLVDLKARFPHYQGESTIFDKGNFLYHTPDSNNLLKLRELYLKMQKMCFNQLLGTQTPKSWSKYTTFKIDRSNKWEKYNNLIENRLQYKEEGLWQGRKVIKWEEERNIMRRKIGKEEERIKVFRMIGRHWKK